MEKRITIQIIHEFIKGCAKFFSLWEKPGFVKSYTHNKITGFVGVDSFVKSKDNGLKFETAEEAVEYIERNFPEFEEEDGSLKSVRVPNNEVSIMTQEKKQFITLNCYRGVDDCRTFDGTIPYDRMNCVIRYVYSNDKELLQSSFAVVEKVAVTVPAYYEVSSSPDVPLEKMEQNKLNDIEISEYYDDVKVLEVYEQ